MATSDIDFHRIRPAAGSRYGGFEELCCQLAYLERPATGGSFYRKGIGADAGVECFVRTHDGRELGWQAKYFFEFTAVQAAQLDDSIVTALKKHPNLRTYIVCIPFDLRDPRTGKGPSELARWEAWRTKHLRKATKAGRSLSIELWSASFLRGLLSRNDPAYSGRAKYWFDAATLTDEWFRDRFGEARANLGERYTPEVSVDVPIRRAVLAFARDGLIAKQLDNWQLEIQERVHSVVRDVRGLKGFGVKDSVALKLSAALESFLRLLQIPYEDARSQIPVDELHDALATLRELNGTAMESVRAAKEPKRQKPKKVKPGSRPAPSRTSWITPVMRSIDSTTY
jgi:hypothetical protein